jgi:polysaccharide pyruvyl transferase WcaK-like protein
MAVTVHIGFDFWGAGNIGDDFVLAGFLSWVRRSGLELRVTALCGHDIRAMRARFPEIEWWASDQASRETAVRDADIWIGLGGSPFQLEVGPWLLDQMSANLEMAKRRGIPAFLVGIGMNNIAGLATDQARRAWEAADGIWLRDEFCRRHAIAAGFPEAKTHSGADLAHLAFAGRASTRVRARTAFVLHADPEALEPEAVVQLVNTFGPECSWFCQEVRRLHGSETELFDLLPDDTKERLHFDKPDYSHAALEDLLDAASLWSRVLSSRYHSSLAAAWSGAALAVFERNDKLRGIRLELGAERCASLSDSAEMQRALAAAMPVPRSLLDECAARADRMLTDVFSRPASGLAS